MSKTIHKRIYVAGPYSADNVIAILDNIRNGTRACVELMLAGYSPFCPWLDYQFQFYLRDGESLSVEDYYRYSIDWLDVADAVYVLPGWESSKGTVAEISRISGTKPIYYDLSELI